jgi:hypothetical protein
VPSAVVTMVATAHSTIELSSDPSAYGCSNVIRQLSSVQSGQRSPSPGSLSNGADASHSSGTAKNASTTAMNTM